MKIKKNLFASPDYIFKQLASSEIVANEISQHSGFLNDSALGGLKEFARFCSATMAGWGSAYEKGKPMEKIKEEAERMNAGEGDFLQRDLELLDPRQFKTLYSDHNYWKSLFPMVDDNMPGMQTYRYQMDDYTGKAALISDGATDVPMANAKAKWYSKDAYSIAQGYQFTVQELRAHIYGNQPLESRKINAALQGFDRAMRDIALNAGTSLTGGVADFDPIINHPNVSNTVVATSTGANVTFAAKIAAGEQLAVIFDIGDMISDANVASQDRFFNEMQPGIIAMPLSQYNLISRTTLSTANASNISIKRYCEENIDGLEKIVPLLDLAGQGTGATDLMVAWINNPEYLEVRNTMPITWQPMQQQGFNFKFIADMRTVGFVLRYAPAMIQRYGI